MKFDGNPPTLKNAEASRRAIASYPCPARSEKADFIATVRLIGHFKRCFRTLINGQ
ncbi:hypothetical protein [Rhodanobacter sp. C05]|uniref:hypothetical protein n=1 Tax=Rhodanobacter sp. C05 TaxID=1945855 RepID=UPI001439C408|nr:hypothetical protein [Rhodanobacter sp. C05]